MEAEKENQAMKLDTDVDELIDLAVEKPSRVTPRTSSAAKEMKPTPYADLRALAGLIRRTSTPTLRRAQSLGPGLYSDTGATKTTSNQLWTTPKYRRPLQQIGPIGSKSTTPHTTRALQQRRTTPGQDRRRSGRTQRETPRDALRNLSKILAGNSQMPRPSPRSASAASGTHQANESQDELSPEQPQFTILADIGEGEDIKEDESSLLDRPRFSLPLEEEEHTEKLLERSRRGSIRDELESSIKGKVGNQSFSEYGDGSTEGQIDYSYENASENRQWQDVQNEIDDYLGGAHSEPNSRPNRESSLRSELSSGGPRERSSRKAAFSPFVLSVPEMIGQDPDENLSAYQDLSAEDIQQFGSPLPFPVASQVQSRKPIIHSLAPKTPMKAKTRARTTRASKTSGHGIKYSSLPVGIVKSISTTFARSVGKKTARWTKESMNAVLEASDRFFEQLGLDLAAASGHAGRKTIDESDIVAIMRRQRQVSTKASTFSLGAKYLPSETLQEMRMSYLIAGRTNSHLKSIPEDLE